VSVEQFIEDVGLHYSRLGLSRTAARAIGALLVFDEPVDAPALVERLGVAKSSLSVALRQLEQWGLVERTRTPQSPRDHYRLVPNMFEAAFRAKLGELTAFRSLAVEGEQLLGSSSPAGARLARLADLYDFMEREIADVVDRWEREHPAG
jgi:DNA-binding MarR family transcriptional regulator